MKTCSKCGVIKPLTLFYKKASRSDGLKGECKSCENLSAVKRKRTKLGLAKRIATQQIHSSKRRGHPKPSYSKSWLVEWLYNQVEYTILYDQWVESNFKKGLSPSVNRINPRKPYTTLNIELVTWEHNHSEAVKDRMNGIDGLTKVVEQLTLDNVLIATWVSGGEISRVLGFCQSSISQCCRGEIQTSNGFKWRYKDA